MGLVVPEREIVVREVEDGGDVGIELHRGERIGFARDLLSRLVEVVEIKVRVAERVDEIAGQEAAGPRDHQGEKRIRCDIERDAEEDVGASLVELTRKPAVEHIELEETVAGREFHAVDVRRIPGADKEATRVGVAADVFDQVRDLVDLPAVGRRPRAPLMSVDGAQFSVLVGPLVPDGHAMVLQVPDVRVAAQEPDELVEDGLQMHFLGRDQRKPFGEVEAHLIAEDAPGPGPGAVGLPGSVLQDVLDEIEVGLHRRQGIE